MNNKLHTQNQKALRLLLNEDLYLIAERKTEVQVLPDLSDNAIVSSIQEIEPTGLVPQTPEQAPEEKSISETISFNYLGENNKYFLILLSDPTHTTLNPKHKEMILKIMGAKGMELRDLAILNLSHYPDVSFHQLKKFFSPSRITLFGTDPEKIALNGIKLNSPKKISETWILSTYSLGTMTDDVLKKKEFWNLMKGF